MSKWAEREPELRRLAGLGMTDEQLGMRFGGISPQAIYHVRRRLGIPAGNGQGGKHHPTVALPEPLTGETYTDADGLTVTRYPARYADGLDSRVTARGKR